MKAYVLYIDSDKSIRYMNDCVASASVDPSIDIIGVKGYNGVDVLKLDASENIGIIPYYLEKLNEGSRETNNAVCCTLGHIKIWRTIAESGEPGIVLEHDALIKGRIDPSLLNDDYDLVWLGYRIKHTDDYKYPLDKRQVLIPTDRFEGTHAYALTPKGAQKLLQNLERDGFNDSLDGQLGMRNIFGLKMAIMDPPPAACLVGDRESCIEVTGNPAQFNASYTPSFLQNASRQNLFQVRNVFLNRNKDFLEAYQMITEVIQTEYDFNNRPIKSMFLGYDEGTIAYHLSNDTLRHPNSRASIVVPQYNIELDEIKSTSTQLVPYNLYFSYYYYKHDLLSVQDSRRINFGLDKDSLDLIFIDTCRMNSDDLLKQLLWSAYNLKPQGLSIFYVKDSAIIQDTVELLSNLSLNIAQIGNFILIRK